MGNRVHIFLWLAGILLFLFFIGYVFLYDHKEGIANSEIWDNEFRRVGINPEDMSHDDSTWYYKRLSTCVGYGGEWEQECPRHENYCSGGKTFGDAKNQVKAIVEALKNRGTHPGCPLIYVGAD